MPTDPWIFKPRDDRDAAEPEDGRTGAFGIEQHCSNQCGVMRRVPYLTYRACQIWRCPACTKRPA